MIVFSIITHYFTMDQLEKKYLNNELTPAELAQLREQTSRLSDQELEDHLSQSWTDSQPDGYERHTVRTQAIGHRLEAQLFPSSPAHRWIRLARIAALWLIPVLLLSTVYFYRQSTRIGDADMLVQVGKGERVSLVLPDGTSVSLNSESELRYNPNSFNKRERSVRFQGEAYFEVTANKEVPFVVNTAGMELKVLGTKFNMLSRRQSKNIEVALIEGHVLLTSCVSSSGQELFANEKASFSKVTGQFTVSREEVSQAVAWRRGDLVFCRQTLQEILQEIELNYNVTFNTGQISALLTDTFTGTLPAHNLIEALEILQYSYGISCTGNNREITLGN